jgi:hypothetical protein
MTELMVLLALLPLDALPNQPTQTPSAVYPRQGGFGGGAYLIGGFFGLGLLLLAMVLLRFPKRAKRPPRDQ